jgi:hypothetical protein
MEAEVAVEQTRALLRHHVSGADSWAEVRDSLDFVARHDPDRVRGQLRGLETVLASSQLTDVLPRLVAWDANWVLDDPSPAAAGEWLRGLADLIRSALAAGAA